MVWWARLLCAISYLEIVSGPTIESILENPWPTLAILSDGSRNGNLFQGINSAFLPYISVRPFSQLAQERPPRGFVVNMASSSFGAPAPLLMIKLYKFLNYCSCSLSALRVSALSANYLDNCATISASLSASALSSCSQSAFLLI